MIARAATLLPVLILTAAAAPAAAQSAADGVACRVEMVPMRDGVRLATEVYLPAGGGRHPVVLTRSPYTRGSLAAGSNCDKRAPAGLRPPRLCRPWPGYTRAVPLRRRVRSVPAGGG